MQGGGIYDPPLLYEATLVVGAVAGSINVQIQQQLRAASSSSNYQRAAAATESSLVQARKSGLTQANIDLQPPSAVNGCAPGQSTAAGNYHCKTLVTQMRR